jgi:hypothetical protein
MQTYIKEPCFLCLTIVKYYMVRKKMFLQHKCVWGLIFQFKNKHKQDEGF